MLQGNLFPSKFLIAPKDRTARLLLGKAFPTHKLPDNPAFTPPSGRHVRSTKAQNGKALAEQFGYTENSVWPARRISALASLSSPGACAFTADDRTLVVAAPNTLRDLIPS